MIAIVSQRKVDDSYYEVGMSNITVTGNYKLLRNLIKYGVSRQWRESGVRLELFYDTEAIYGKPFKILYI